ncbi:aldehyde dehydrogenase family 3 member F1 [Corchorus olitorius]|uniref:Aldehyde dehydrogenase family 3 member F1 n=1 Tax=Corchorus olitorius TaxID=93759 RepID=A0A1R3KS99_9ROSI|nr:aldehyde dehydrogenase family 3 member F1 [Corchorus olitorius]
MRVEDRREGVSLIEGACVYGEENIQFCGGCEWERYFVSAVSEVGRVSFLERIVEGEVLGSI